MSDRYPIKTIASCTLGKMMQGGALSDGDSEHYYLRAASVQEHGKLDTASAKSMWFNERELRALSLRAGDVVVVEGGSAGRSAVLREALHGWGFQNSIVRVRPNPGVSDGRFLDYCIQSARNSGEIESLVSASTIAHFTAEKVARLRVWTPPLNEQRAIADYLDRETAQIDAFIAKNEELITLLIERRASQIAEAVSRGIDTSRQLIDAPKLALGTMPAHWSLTPLKRAVGYQEGPGIMASDFRESGVPLLRISSVNTATATLEGCNFLDPDLVRDRWSHFQVAMGDLLISASASMGTVAEVVTEEVVGAVPYTGIIRISQGEMLRDFAKWFFISEEFLTQVEALKTGSTIQHFGPTHLGQMWVALPPAPEQLAIAASLRFATARIDDSIRTAMRGVSLARERRAALISAAVTGKIDLGVSV